MTIGEFNQVVEARINLIREVLASKSAEYSTDDKLHNFKEAAKEFGDKPTEVCWQYMRKHLISIKDIAHGRHATLEQISEKIGDAINYLILMEALLIEGKRG